MIMLEPGKIKTKPFKGSIVSTPKETIGIILKVNKHSVSGLFLDGDFDCMYRYCNIVKAKTRKGFCYKGKTPLDFYGYIDGEMLEKAISLADTNDFFGNGSYHSG